MQQQEPTTTIPSASDLIRRLSGSGSAAGDAAFEIRRLAKSSSSARAALGPALIPHLLRLLAAWRDPETRTHAVTALFNLTLRNDANKAAVVAGAENIDAILRAKEPEMAEARENAAALVCNISTAAAENLGGGGEQAHVLSSIVEGLVSLMNEGSPRGKRDAAAALYNLVTAPRRRPVRRQLRAAAIRSGAVHVLLQQIGRVGGGVQVEESLALILLLAAHQEGRLAILSEDDDFPSGGLHTLLAFLYDDDEEAEVEAEARCRLQEFSSAILLLLCQNDAAAADALQRLGAFETVFRLSQSGGTERARRTANRLLELL